MKKANGVNFSLAQRATKRRVNALARLEASLEANEKTVKGTVNEKEPLSEADIKRMTKEIANLKSKIARG